MLILFATFSRAMFIQGAIFIPDSRVHISFLVATVIHTNYTMYSLVIFLGMKASFY